MHIAEAVAYEWGVNGGVMKYTYPSDKRPDTSEDVLSLGFISPSFDAVLVRVDSDPKMNNDYLQLEIVSEIIFLKKTKINTRHVKKLSLPPICFEFWRKILNRS